MPGNEEHRRGAVITGGVAGIIAAAGLFHLYGNALASVGVLTAFFILPAIGTDLPDTDSHSSLPRKRLNHLLIGVCTLGGAVVIYRFRETLISAVSSWTQSTYVAYQEYIIIGAIVFTLFLAAKAGVPKAVQAVMPAHRGPMHSAPLWIGTFAVLGVAGIYYIPFLSIQSPGLPEAVFGAVLVAPLWGVIDHLGRDGELT